MARQQKPEVVEVSVVEAPKKSLFQCVAGYLDANDWNYTANEEKKFFSMGCHLKDANVRILIDVSESDDWRQVLVYVVFPVFIPEYRRMAVTESLARINYALTFGNLEMDLKDGEVRVRTTVESNGALGDAMIDRVLNSALGVANRYLAPIIAVAFGNAAPDTVLDLVTKQDDATLQ